MRRRGVGQQDPGLLAILGVQHDQRAGQGLLAEGLARPHPKRARPAAQRPYRHPVAAGWAEGDMRRVAQDGMPAQLPEPCPQGAAVQPPVAEEVHRHPGRHRRSQPPQQTPVVGNPGFRRVGPHHVPGPRDRLFAVGHADHQRHPLVPLMRGVAHQHQGRPRPVRLRLRRPQRPHPAQPLREAGLHLHLRARPPGADAVRVVAGPLPQLPAHGFMAPVHRQGRRRRILAAVVGQDRALHPQGQVPPQAALHRGQILLELAGQGIQ